MHKTLCRQLPQAPSLETTRRAVGGPLQQVHGRSRAFTGQQDFEAQGFRGTGALPPGPHSEATTRLGRKALSAKNTVLMHSLRYNILKIFGFCKILGCKKYKG